MGWMKELATFAEERGLPMSTPVEELYAGYMAWDACTCPLFQCTCPRPVASKEEEA